VAKTRIRSAYLVIAALVLVLITIRGLDAVFPLLALAVLSFPAGLLASPLTEVLFDFPVEIEGLPFPPAWWIYALLALGLGYVQWFVAVPWLFRMMRPRHFGP
jgi:hypothetical protein